VALFRADGVAARQNRPAILPRRAFQLRKNFRNRPRSDKCQQPLNMNELKKIQQAINLMNPVVVWDIGTMHAIALF